jgi:hypothetical protein
MATTNMIDFDEPSAKIKTDDMIRARDCVQWLIEHIGPQQPGVVGNVINGIGWQLRVLDTTKTRTPTVEITLNHHVDEEDVTMFLLRWT